jgi:hypothetical protein
MMKRFILLLLLLSFSFAGVSCPEVTASTILNSELLPDIGPTIAVVFMLTILIIVFAYAGGQLLENQNMTIFAKDELYHLLFSAAMLAAIGGILAFSCVISSGLMDFSLKGTGAAQFSCYSSSSNVFDIASCFMNRVKTDADWIAGNALKKSIEKQQEAVSTVSIYFPMIGGTTTSYVAYKRTYAMMYDLLYTSFLAPLLMSITLQAQLIDFMKIFGPGVLFPLAFLLRVFPATRSMGNILIGLGIGLVTIFPIMYALNASMYETVFKSCDGMEDITDDTVLGSCGFPGSFFDIAKLIPQAFFLPNLTLAVFITFLSAMNRALKVIG